MRDNRIRRAAIENSIRNRSWEAVDALEKNVSAAFFSVGCVVETSRRWCRWAEKIKKWWWRQVCNNSKIWSNLKGVTSIAKKNVRNIRVYWYLHNPEEGTVIIFHRHNGQLPYHLHSKSSTLSQAVKQIKAHDAFQLNGRRPVRRWWSISRQHCRRCLWCCLILCLILRKVSL